MSPFNITYLPVNDAWALTYQPHATQPASIITLDRFERGRRLFPTRDELVAALKACGFAARDNAVFLVA